MQYPVPFVAASPALPTAVPPLLFTSIVVVGIVVVVTTLSLHLPTSPCQKKACPLLPTPVKIADRYIIPYHAEHVLIH